MDFNEALRSVAEALLIGFLLGAEREASKKKSEPKAGMRDFLVIAIIGAVCALIDLVWLTAAALLSVAGLLAILRSRSTERTGLTTELAALAAFALAFLAATPLVPYGSTIAVILTIVLALALEAKDSLHRLVRESITEEEFNATLRFLAIIFVVYPVLPEGRIGPFGAFNPREIWLFVILVSSVSYLGYFLQKYLGVKAGLRITALVGGLASTTAATASLAKAASGQPAHLNRFWQAVVLANAMQFPRVLAILAVVSRHLALQVWLPLTAMTVAGLGMGYLLGKRPEQDGDATRIALQNPFQIGLALQLGALFAGLVFVTKATANELSTLAGLWVVAVGGSVHADAAALAASDLLNNGGAHPAAAAGAVLLALLANALVKTGIAAYAGGTSFALRTAAGFAVMFAAGLAGWLAWASGIASN